MKPPIKLQIESLTQEPYASILCYPHSKPKEIMNRICELSELGVEAVEFVGDGSASNVPVLGKGYVGIVVTAYLMNKKYALKMRRLDADRVSLDHEAVMLQKANSVNVGPKFVAVSKNFMLSQLVDGLLLVNWLEKHRADKSLVSKILLIILEQCWRLDEIGLDHGELSKAPRHLLVDKSDTPFIVDFETASVTRKASNVTSVCQYLFAGNSQVPKFLAEINSEKDLSVIISVLRDYKKNRTRENFERILKVCI